MFKYRTDQEWFAAEKERNKRAYQKRKQSIREKRESLGEVKKFRVTPPPKPKAEFPENILVAAAKASGMSRDLILEKYRYNNMVRVRMMMFHYLFTIGIGDSSVASMCEYDRTSIRYLRKKHEFEYKYYEGYRTMYDKFLELVNAKD